MRVNVMLGVSGCRLLFYFTYTIYLFKMYTKFFSLHNIIYFLEHTDT